jgi:hypothetical protein
MPELTVVRWHRYGKDRLYVNTADGARVGWVDRQTGTTTLEMEALAEEFRQAIEAYSDGGDTRPAPVPQLPWTDLAQNQPAELVRAQARAAREAAPVRTLLERAFRVHGEERAWRIGADGEEMVAAQLAALPPEWRVLHGIPVGTRGADIDHLVIGPGGLYSVNTKHHPDASIWVRGDQVKVDGHSQQYVRKARYEAQRVTSTLQNATGIPAVANGLLAMVGARGGWKIVSQPSDGLVHIVARRDLTNWFLRRGPLLDEHQVDQLFEAARRSTTWLPGRA